jgi:hypothetical protein
MPFKPGIERLGRLDEAPLCGATEEHARTFTGNPRCLLDKEKTS